MVVDFRRQQGRGSGLHMVAILAEPGQLTESHTEILYFLVKLMLSEGQKDLWT